MKTNLIILFFVGMIALQISSIWLQIKSISERNEALHVCEEQHKVKCKMSATPEGGV
jgi:hypothetical protein